MMKTKILFLLTVFIFMGCKNKSNTTDVNKALIEVTTKFPQLSKGGINYYKLEKSVKNEKFNFEIQLYTETDTIRDPQKILVVINKENECYAIPLLSNTYRDYWQFKNEVPLPKIKKVQSTFTKQYLNALITLKLNKIEAVSSVTNEMLISILGCNKITNCDFINLENVVYANNNKALDSENNYKELKEKWKKNNEEILNTNNNDVDDFGVQEIRGYLDRKNYRFYQVIFDVNIFNIDKNPKKIITSEKDLQIKSYRKDQIVHMISL